MKQAEAVNLWTLSIIEDWNENNLTQKLSPELISIIDVHLRRAFVSGVDAMAAEIIPKLNAQENSQISKHYIKSLIQNFEP